MNCEMLDAIRGGSNERAPPRPSVARNQDLNRVKEEQAKETPPDDEARQHTQTRNVETIYVDLRAIQGRVLVHACQSTPNSGLVRTSPNECPRTLPRLLSDFENRLFAGNYEHTSSFTHGLLKSGLVLMGSTSHTIHNNRSIRLPTFPPRPPKRCRRSAPALRLLHQNLASHELRVFRPSVSLNSKRPGNSLGFAGDRPNGKQTSVSFCSQLPRVIQKMRYSPRRRSE